MTTRKPRGRAAPVGAVVGLYYDDPSRPIEQGHVIQTSTGRTYRVLEVRRARVRDADVERWYLRAVVVENSSADPVGDVVHPLDWYRRERHSIRRERMG